MEQLKHQYHGFEDMKTGIHTAFNFTVPETEVEPVKLLQFPLFVMTVTTILFEATVESNVSMVLINKYDNKMQSQNKKKQTFMDIFRDENTITIVFQMGNVPSND